MNRTWEISAIWKKAIALRKKSDRILLFVAIISILGCLEEKSKYTINADCSGKATFELTFTPSHLVPSKPGAAPEHMITHQIEEILLRSKGIDIWKDISFRLTDEGSIHFIGTAYFPDANKLSLWRPDIREISRLQFSKDKSGRIIIESSDSPDQNNEMGKKSAPELSEAELALQVKLTKLRYKQVRPMLQSAFGTLKQEWFLYLPAKIEKISNIEKVDDTTVRWKMTGSEMLDSIDKLMTNDERLKLFIREGKDPFESSPAGSLFNEMFLGKKGPIRIVLNSDSKNLFDYNAEVDAARGDFDRMLKELGLVLTRPEPISTPTVSNVPAEPGTVKVGGVRLVRYEDEERGIRPLSWGNNYTLSLIMELGEPNLIITHGRVEKAITDTGQNILGIHTGISSPKLSKDGKSVIFDVKLSVPDEDANGLAELSGVLVHLKSAGIKEIDLGVMDFKKGAKSKVPGFAIRSIRPDWNKGHTRMELKVNLLLGTIKSTTFYREDGTELIVSQGGKSFSSDRLMDIDYKIKGKFPPRGRIVLEVLDEITKHEISFKLTNISLTGKPL